MSIVGGFDLHRKQITFNYLDTVTGQVQRGQIAPADRGHLAAWLGRFAGRQDVTFAVEGCTGWRYVVEELAAAGVGALLAEPAETAARRGRKKRAKTDRSDAALIRDLVAGGRVPQCWIPPSQVLEYRALLETFHDLRREHTAWVQRVHAVLFHHGAEELGVGGVGTVAGRERLAVICERQLSAAGRVQVATCLTLADALDGQIDAVRGRIVAAARHMRGARVLAQEVYGVGPVAALALTCWLGGAGRFSSARKAVRFAGLDVTVYSSAGKRSPGCLSRQGPPVLRWCLYEAGKTSARASAPDHVYYTKVKDRLDGKRAALSEARKIVRIAVHKLDALGEEAFTPV